jgi:hypothetical protein
MKHTINTAVEELFVYCSLLEAVMLQSHASGCCGYGLLFVPQITINVAEKNMSAFQDVMLCY